MSQHSKRKAARKRIELDTIKVEKFTDGLDIAKAHLEFLGLYPRYSLSEVDIIEAEKVNFLKEMSGLKKWQEHREGTFDFARLQLFKSFSTFLLELPLSFPEDDFRIMEGDIRKAAQLMYDIDGMRGLEDPLIWLFLPRGWQRTVDNFFSGIGEWLS